MQDLDLNPAWAALFFLVLVAVVAFMLGRWDRQDGHHRSFERGYDAGVRSEVQRAVSQVRLALAGGAAAGVGPRPKAEGSVHISRAVIERREVPAARETTPVTRNGGRHHHKTS